MYDPHYDLKEKVMKRRNGGLRKGGKKCFQCFSGFTKWLKRVLKQLVKEI